MARMAVSKTAGRGSIPWSPAPRVCCQIAGLAGLSPDTPASAQGHRRPPGTMANAARCYTRATRRSGDKKTGPLRSVPERVGAAPLGAVVGRKGGQGEQVGLGGLEELGDFGGGAGQLLNDMAGRSRASASSAAGRAGGWRRRPGAAGRGRRGRALAGEAHGAALSGAANTWAMAALRPRCALRERTNGRRAARAA